MFLHCALFGFLLRHSMEGDELTNHITEIRKIVAHSTTEIDVVYTDDSYVASKTVDMYEQ
jgi:predicted metal-dependent peptidase